MKIRQICFVVGTCALAATSQASYELVLAAKATGADAVIQRFDGNTGAYLGSFGQGVLYAPDQIAVDPSDGSCFVTDQGSNSIFAFNYSTGEYIRGIPVSGATQIKLMQNGHLLVSSGANLYEMTKTGSVVRSVNVGSTIYSVGQAPDGTIFTYAVSKAMRRYDSTLTTLLGSSTMSQAFYGGFSFRGSEMFVCEYLTNSIVSMTVANIPSVNYTKPLPAGYSFPLGMALGHDDRLYISANNATDPNKSIMRYQLSSGISPYQFGSSSSSMRGLAVVNAPEPGTWMAIGLGVIGLVARRRRPNR